MKKNQSIDIPLLFFFCAFCIVLFGLSSKLMFQKGGEVNTNIKPTTIAASPKNKTAQLKSINYNLPVRCEMANTESSISAQLEGTSLTATIQTKSEIKKVIVMDDCVFIWIEKEQKGRKQCGIGQYISIGKQLLEMGLATPETINSMASQMGKSLPIDLGTVLKSCKNVKEIKKEVFMVPVNIKFSE